MKINRENLHEDYMKKVSEICDREDQEFRVSFEPKEIIDILSDLLETGEYYER